MDEIMQVLFNDVIDRLLQKYYDQTAYATRCKSRDEIGRRLWEQLPAPQKEQLEELQRAYDAAQMAELEAVFLAAFDQCKALARSHSA